MYNDSDFFYFSDTYDLTNSLQRQNTDGYQNDKPLWERADERFFWNKPMLEELMEEQARRSCDAVELPISGHPWETQKSVFQDSALLLGV